MELPEAKVEAANGPTCPTWEVVVENKQSWSGLLLSSIQNSPGPSTQFRFQKSDPILILVFLVIGIGQITSQRTDGEVLVTLTQVDIFCWNRHKNQSNREFSFCIRIRIEIRVVKK
jgi:hypothetical protein